MRSWTKIETCVFNGEELETVWQWFEEMGVDPDDWKLDSDAWDEERIYVRDPNIALLFKLRFGGK